VKTATTRSYSPIGTSAGQPARAEPRHRAGRDPRRAGEQLHHLVRSAADIRSASPARKCAPVRTRAQTSVWSAVDAASQKSSRDGRDRRRRGRPVVAAPRRHAEGSSTSAAAAAALSSRKRHVRCSARSPGGRAYWLASCGHDAHARRPAPCGSRDRNARAPRLVKVPAGRGAASRSIRRTRLSFASAQYRRTPLVPFDPRHRCRRVFPNGPLTPTPRLSRRRILHAQGDRRYVAAAGKGENAALAQERRRFQRVRINLLGRYMLADRREYSVRSQHVAGRHAVIAPVTARRGALIAYIDHVAGSKERSRALSERFAMSYRRRAQARQARRQLTCSPTAISSTCRKTAVTAASFRAGGHPPGHAERVHLTCRTTVLHRAGGTSTRGRPCGRDRDPRARGR